MKKVLVVLMVVVLAVAIGCTVHNVRNSYNGSRPICVQQEPTTAPAVQVVQQEPTTAPATEAVAPPAKCGPKMFLNEDCVLIKGAKEPEMATFVCIEVPTARNGLQAYTGKKMPEGLELPPGTRLVQIQINNHGKWIPVWAVSK